MNFFSILSVGVAVVNVSLLDAFSFPRATLLNKSSTKLRCSTKEQYECKIHDSAPLLPNFNDSIKIIQKGIATIALTAAITAATATTSVATANELIDLDASSSLPTGEDTVELVLQNLKDATGDTGKSFKVFETVNEIITEGKGVGGSLSYRKFVLVVISRCLYCYVYYSSISLKYTVCLFSKMWPVLKT